MCIKRLLFAITIFVLQSGVLLAEWSEWSSTGQFGVCGVEAREYTQKGKRTELEFRVVSYDNNTHDVLLVVEVDGQARQYRNRALGGRRSEIAIKFNSFSGIKSYNVKVWDVK